MHKTKKNNDLESMPERCQERARNECLPKYDDAFPTAQSQVSSHITPSTWSRVHYRTNIIESELFFSFHVQLDFSLRLKSQKDTPTVVSCE